MIRQNVPLKDYSNYKIGGPAAYFLEVSTKEELIKGIKEWEEMGLNKRIFVLGKGTNILINDEGFDGFVIHNNILGIERKENDLIVGAGVLVSDILNYCIENSLSGLEWAGGLPGTIGGAVRGNAGAFGGEAKDCVKEAISFNLLDKSQNFRKNKDCNFSYRYSFFKSREGLNEIITSVILKLKPREKESIRQSVLEKIDYRKAKHPLELPNIGSTFKNIPFDSLSPELQAEWRQYIKSDPFPVIPVAKVIYLAGLMGKRVGSAQISEKHTNFIVNLGGATSNDVKQIIEEVKTAVNEKFGVILEEEIMYLGGGD